MSATLDPIVDALVKARLQQSKIAPEDFPLEGLEQGYQLQQQIMQQYGQQGNLFQTGWKIALTGPMAQQKYGITEPVYGQLLQDMCFQQQASIQLAPDDAVKLEVELVFVLNQDLVPDQQYDDQQLLEAVGDIVPALEIVNVRWKHWNFSLGQFLADNAAAQGYVVGQPMTYDFKLESLQGIIESSNFDSTLTVNENDHPVKNYIWLVRSLLNQGQSFKAGQHILTGSLIRPLGVSAGTYKIDIAGQTLTLNAE